MEEGSFDCVIVGARCAGAPLATHLQRAGMKVCLLDQDTLPSDQPFSTHGILPLGMDYLDEVGVGAAIRRVAPPVHASRLTVGRAHVDLPLPKGREMYCPRRSTLDALLLEAAVAAGAEVRDETAVLDVIRDGGRVVGVKARHAGVTADVRGRFVVGADGRNSTVARLVGAAAYHEAEGLRGGYWSYFPMTPAFASLPYQTGIEIQGTSARMAFQTDGGLVLAGALDSLDVSRHWRKDPERHVRESLMRSDAMRLLVDGNAAASRFVGLMGGRFFFRAAVGPGWALVGDAGLHKDPTPGYGITDALRDAKALSRALLDGRDAALEVYWRERDVLSIPLFANANAMGSLDYDNPFNTMILERAPASPKLQDRLRATIEREISPFEMVPAWRVLAWTMAALLRGHSEIWPYFLASAKRGGWVGREMKLRTALLETAMKRLASA